MWIRSHPTHLGISAHRSREGVLDLGAALFTGAMIELVQQCLPGRLGSDLEAVLAYAVKRVLIT